MGRAWVGSVSAVEWQRVGSESAEGRHLIDSGSVAIYPYVDRAPADQASKSVERAFASADLAPIPKGEVKKHEKGLIKEFS